MTSIAIHLLRNAGPHCAALESHLGPHRTQASHYDRPDGPLHIHVLLRVVADFLGSGDQVRVLDNSSTPLTDLTDRPAAGV